MPSKPLYTLITRLVLPNSNCSRRTTELNNGPGPRRALFWSTLLLALLLALSGLSLSPARADSPVFINEIHYDNAGVDTGESVEIAGSAGTDLSGWSIVLYNGVSTVRAPYDTVILSGVIPNQCNGYGTIVVNYPTDGIQNGSPDGLALVDDTGSVVQFLSYEGSFTAVSGLASGLTSTDIGVAETNTTPVGYSLQLSGDGSTYEDFTWNAPAANTFGACNTNQNFPSSAIAATKTDADIDGDGRVDPGDTLRYTVTITNSGSGTATGLIFTDTVDANTAYLAGSLRVSPVALDDQYQAVTSLTVPDGSTDLFANDYPGQNPAVGGLSSFGGGSLPGDASTNPAGDTVTFGSGGSLAVNTNGSFTFNPGSFTGEFTFYYRLQNVASSSDGLVTIEVGQPPTANADGIYTVEAGNNLTITTADPNDLLDNDDLGSPAATLTSFGGGSLGGVVTSNNSGDSVALAGGTLTVNADGSFSLIGPTTPGDYTFQYRLSNNAGTSDAAVSIQTQKGPVAEDDPDGGPQPTTSAPGDDLHTALNTTLTSIGYNLLDNDDLGSPAATLASFGAIELNDGTGIFLTPLGTVTTNAAGSTVSFNGVGGYIDGSLTVNAAGSFTFVPPTNYTGILRFQYRLNNIVSPDDATVELAVAVRPTAVTDNYPATLAGNVSINTNTNSQFSVISNDSGDDLSFAATSLTSANGGNVILNGVAGSNFGEFSYNPPPGYEGLDSFNYTLRNGFGPANGAVNLTISGMIWFVNNTAVVNGDGRLGSPFNTLTSLNGTGDVDDPADTIFLFAGGPGYSGTLNLENNQYLIGQGASSSIGAITGLTPPADSPALPATGGTNPTIIHPTSGNGVALAQHNTLRGLSFGSTAGGYAIVNGGGSIGTATVGNATSPDVSITGIGGLFSITSGGTFNASFNQLSMASPSFSGAINLFNVNGTISHSSGNIVSNYSTSPVINIDGGAPNLIYSGSVTKNTDGRVVQIQNMTGGIVTLSGNLLQNNPAGTGILIAANSGGAINFSGNSKVLNTGANPAVTLSSNSGATINFSNGGLDIDTTSGAGLSATGGGTVNVTGANNTVNSITGAAVNMANTTIGTGGVTFRSVTVNGASNGIILNNTGTTGSFTVTGDGSLARNGSGGTIQNTTGDAISLTNAHDVTLQAVDILNSGARGVNAASASGVIVSAMTIQNPASQAFNGAHLSGSNRIDGSLVTGAGGDASIRLENFNTNLTAFTLDNSTFSNPTGTSAAVMVLAHGTSDMTLNVQDCLFEGVTDRAIFTNAGASAGSSGTVSTNISNSTFRNAAINGAGGVLLQVSQPGATQQINVANNIFSNLAQTTSGPGIIYLGVSGGQLLGTITGNSIDNSTAGYGNQRGIEINVSPSSGSFGRIDVTVTDNDIDELPQNEAISVYHSSNVDNSGWDSELVITNNRIGQKTGSVGVIGGSQVAVEIFSEIRDPGSTFGVLMDNNLITANTSNQVVDIDSRESTSMSLGVTNNTLTNLNLVLGMVFTADTVSLNPSMCLNLDANTASGGFGSPFVLTESAGVFTVQDLATVGARNTGAVSVGAGITDSGGTCIGIPVASLLYPLPGQAELVTRPNTGMSVQPAVELLTPAGWIKPARRAVGGLASPLLPGYLPAAIAPHKPLADGETLTVTLPNLPPDKEVTLVFEMVITDTIPAGTETVANQGTVQGDNLADVPTDDPEVSGSNDPTETNLDLPQVSVTAGSAPAETGPTNGAFVVSLNPAPAAPVTIKYLLSGSAANPADYSLNENDPDITALTASDFTVAAGVTSVTLQVVPVDDAVTDPGETVQLTLTTVSGQNYTIAAAPDNSALLTIADNDIPGFTIDPTSLTVAENSGSGVFSVTLNTQPTGGAAVTLPLSTSGPCQVSTTSLTIFNADWNVAHTVTVTGTNDNIDNPGDQRSCTVDTGDPTSAAPEYESLVATDVANVDVSVTDDDSAGFTISAISGDTSENGDQATFTIRLNSQPAGNVVIDVASSNPGEGTISPTPLTFTPLNWSDIQTVTVTGADDGDNPDGDVGYTIQLAIDTANTADPIYATLEPDDVVVVNRDNDARPIYLPLITKGFISVPDLVVTEVVATSTVVTVTIRNAGTETIIDAFWVDVYFNPSVEPPSVNQPWQTIAPAGAAWGVTQALGPGEALVLTSRPGDLYFVPAESSGPPFPVGARVFAYVDSVNFSTNYGNVRESIEGNNWLGPEISTAGQVQPALTGAARLPNLSELPSR